MIEVTTQLQLDKALKKDPGGEITLAKGSFTLRITGAVAPLLILTAGAYLDVAGSPSARPKVDAWGNSTVTAWGNSTVTARENSTVTAWGNSTVTAWGNSTVTAWGNSTVTAWGNSTVTAWGYSFVRAFSAKRVVASPLCIVARHAGNVIVEGGQVIECPAPATPEAWCDHYGVTVNAGVATLYKAVNADGKSPHGYDYSPGLTPVAHDWDGGIAECGGGLHFSPHPMMALEFHEEAKRFIACPVALVDIAVHAKADMPQKVKARGCCAPTLECDRNAVPLETLGEAA